ncbi:hypothetical protein LAZ67_10001859 [Cordylochernes scorpioides]|uniref:Phage protein n=1 Tax=Cordylochernes scorpioides TaxID=51811 RepID=A0ABY6KZZ6_9ARAC|nr:hypothetical protein LAZ67_10001859 [Cordylochernes scorpioides]
MKLDFSIRQYQKSLIMKCDTTKGVKNSKERMSIVLLTNVLGEKEKPIVIGKAKNPRTGFNFLLDEPDEFERDNKERDLLETMAQEMFGCTLKQLMEFKEEGIFERDNQIDWVMKPFELIMALDKNESEVEEKEESQSAKIMSFSEARAFIDGLKIFSAQKDSAELLNFIMNFEEEFRKITLKDARQADIRSFFKEIHLKQYF